MAVASKKHGGNAPEQLCSNHLVNFYTSSSGCICCLKVAIARDNRKGIELYTKSGKLYHERAATRDQLRYIKTKAKSREEQVLKMEEARIG